MDSVGIRWIAGIITFLKKDTQVSLTAGVLWTHFEERCFCESILQAPTHCFTSRPLYPWRLLSEIALVHSHFPPRKCLSILQDSSWVTPYAHTILPPPAHSCFSFFLRPEQCTPAFLRDHSAYFSFLPPCTPTL